MKKVDFSETIAAYDLKVCRCRQLIELMKVGQGHFLKIKTGFSQKPVGHFEPNFVHGFPDLVRHKPGCTA